MKKLVAKSGLFMLVLVIIFSFTGCVGDLNGDVGEVDSVTLTGNPVTYNENDEEYRDTYALLVLVQDGEEVERYFKDSDESAFEFDDLKTGNYQLKVYYSHQNVIEKDLVLEDNENIDLGRIVIEREEIPEDEMNGTFLLSFNTEEEYVANENVRLAIAHAIDREEIMKVFVENIHVPDNGIAYETKLANRLGAPVVYGYDEEQDINLSQNIVKAKEYMENAEFDGEVVVDFYHFQDNIYEKVVGSIKNSLAEVDGLSINPIPVAEDSEIIDGFKSFYPIAFIYTRSPLRGYDDIMTNEMKEIRHEAGMNLDDLSVLNEKILEFEKVAIEEGRIIPIFHRASYPDE